MIFDGRIFKITGASDYEDSSMFNGLIALFEYDSRVDWALSEFFSGALLNGKYVRHPYGSKYNFSRDQYLPLAAGYWKKNHPGFVHESFIDGNDILSPANHGHTRRCQNGKANWFQNLWLKAEILFHAKFTPLDEPNQLIAMMCVAGPEYLKLWTKNNPQWQRSIKKYWCEEDGHWRAEPEFAEHMILKIKQAVSA
jgi:hypothetical protein